MVTLPSIPKWPQLSPDSLRRIAHMRALFARSILFLSLVLLTFAGASAQNAVSTVTGVVSDASGAVLPGSQVLLTNPATNASFKAETNSAGSYRFAEVPPGPGYQMTFTHDGFATYTVKDVYVNVANSRTQNARLSPGSSITLEVTAEGQGVTINTEDATIGNNFQVEQLNELPVQSRTSPAVLFTLQPGITLNGATTGARTDQTNTLVDGLDVNDFATGGFGSIIGNAPVDSVQEFRGTTAGFNPNSGQGGGGQFQLVTKSGTNHFHGNVNEYHRDNSTTANNWFNDNAIPVIRSPKLVRNQFGGNLGGPILHDRAFFFFNFNAGRIAAQSAQMRTVPLPSFVAGNVSYINNSAGCLRTSRQNTTPNCISQLTPAQVKAMDPAGIGASPALANLLKRYPAPNDLTGGDGVNTGLYRFNSATPDNLTGYVGKVDYRLNSKISFYGVTALTRQNQVRTAAQFPGDDPASQFVDRSYRFAGGMIWQISQNKINQFTYGETVADLSFPRPANALGVNQVVFASGTTTLLTAPYASPSNAQSRHIPTQQVNDDFTWQLGRHSVSFGGFYKWINTSSKTTLDYNTDTVGLGGQTQSFIASFRPPNILPNGTVNGVNNGTTAGVTFDSAYAAILGRVGAVGTTYNYDATGTALPLATGNNRNYKYKQTLFYASDSWKVTPNLTVGYGLNYQLFTVPYEANGLESTQTTTFDSYVNARVVQSAAGNTSANGVPFLTYVLGGKANNGPDLYHQQNHDIAPRLSLSYVPPFDPKTVFNAGAGIEYDRTVTNAVQFQQDQKNYLFSQLASKNYGSSTNGAALLATDPRYDAPPTLAAPATPKPPFTPYVVNGVPNGLPGNQFNTTIDPNLKTPYSISTNFGMQHEFPAGFVLKVSYSGRFGRRLLGQADASQLIDFTDPKSGQTLGQAITSLEVQARNNPGGTKTYKPEPYFENQYGATLLNDPSACGKAGTYASATNCIATGNASLLQIGDFADIIQGISGDAVGYNTGLASQFAENTVYTNKGFSTYHGLLVTLQKNLARGLKFDVNYTWSHSIDNVSLIANSGAAGGYGFVCDVLRPRLCRGNSDFDATHNITSDFLYQLPFGRGRAFGTHLPLIVEELAGGWSVSGIVQYQSGTAFSAVTSAFVPGYSNNSPAIFNGNNGALRRQVHKKADGTVSLFADANAAVNAFSAPTGFNIGSRNILRGPQFADFDASVGKSFAIWPRENVNLKFRADAFNSLNRPNFLSPGSNTIYDDITNAGQFGQLTAVPSTGQNGAPRVLQLSLRLEF